MTKKEVVEVAINRKNLITNIEGFLKSDEKCMLITGTHQYEKHITVITVLNRFYRNTRILFRTNAIQNITQRDFLGRFIKKAPKAGEKIKVGNNIYEIDSFNNSGTWNKTSLNFHAAIVYPIDAITRNNASLEGIKDLFEDKNIEKIFLVSWTDRDDDYSLYKDYVDRHIVFDAEEENLEYHNRVMALRAKYSKI